MTYLLLQTFLLLLAAYFFGAFLACTVKRAIFGARDEEPASLAVPVMVDPPIRAPVVASPAHVRARPVPPPVVPRSIDPVQPRIDVLRRPAPRSTPKLIDPSRFERALMGPDPNEGMPRRAIAEIRPVVLKPVTGAYLSGSYGPPLPPPEPEILPMPAPETLPPPVAAVIDPVRPRVSLSTALKKALPSAEGDDEFPQITPILEEPVKRAKLSDATTSAAASAVAAAKAAAAASIVPMLRTFTRDTTKAAPPPPHKEEPVEDENTADRQVDEQVVDDDQVADDQPDDVSIDDEEDEKPVQDADNTEDDFAEDTEEEIEQVAEELAAKPQSIAMPPIEGGDDFQRIRAIDVALEQRLKAEGVDSFEHIAAWNPADVKRMSQLLGIPGRVDREQWIEQAQILAKGGETYYSRNRLAAQKAATPAPPSAVTEAAESLASKASSSSEEETSASQSASEAPASQPAPPKATEPEKSELTAQPGPQLSGVAAAIQGRSVAEMAAAAAAAIAAASASVTRGLKPIEPISPLSKVDPKISIPAKLSDAIKEKEASTPPPARSEVAPPRPMTASSLGPDDDLKRIRGVGVLIEKRLNAMGITRYEQIANWTSGEIDRVSQMLEFKGRIEREGWVEQARILLNGGQTEFSRRVDRGEVDTSRET